jgi:hypothetical protein
MGLNWNEIKSSALLFSNIWGDAIEHAAQCVLDAAVDATYQPSGGTKSDASDADRVAFLFELYQRFTSLLPASVGKKTRKSKTKGLEF